MQRAAAMHSSLKELAHHAHPLQGRGEASLCRPRDGAGKHLLQNEACSSHAPLHDAGGCIHASLKRLYSSQAAREDSFFSALLCESKRGFHSSAQYAAAMHPSLKELAAKVTEAKKEHKPKFCLNGAWPESL